MRKIFRRLFRHSPFPPLFFLPFLAFLPFMAAKGGGGDSSIFPVQKKDKSSHSSTAHTHQVHGMIFFVPDSGKGGGGVWDWKVHFSNTVSHMTENEKRLEKSIDLWFSPPGWYIQGESDFLIPNGGGDRRPVVVCGIELFMKCPGLYLFIRVCLSMEVEEGCIFQMVSSSPTSFPNTKGFSFKNHSNSVGGKGEIREHDLKN